MTHFPFGKKQIEKLGWNTGDLTHRVGQKLNEVMDTLSFFRFENVLSWL